MSDSFIPRRDSDALIWFRAFADGIQAEPATFELTPADATTLVDAVDAFQAALIVAGNPATRTQGTVNTKDTARNAAEAVCRQYAIQIKHNAGIDDAKKIDIGVRPLNEDREPIFCPETSPLLNVICATPGAQTVRYADSMTPDSAAKPFGAIGLQLFVAVEEGPIADADDASFHGVYTKNPVGVLFAEADDGKMATYFARWAGRRGDVGPWSVPVSMRIAA